MIHLLSLALVPYAVADQDVEAAEFLNLAVGAFSLVLLALSLSAYRKTSMRRLLLVSTAFGLFAVSVLINQLDVFVFALGYEFDQMVTVLMEFLILLLFFFAVVKK